MTTDNLNEHPKETWIQPTIEELDITETTLGKANLGAESAGAFTGS